MIKITSIFFLLFTVHANAKTLFKCHVPINPYDMDFEQGQEIFLDIELIDEQPKLTLYKLDGKKQSLLEKSEIKRYGFGHEFTTFGVAWDKNYLSMVYIGNRYWGAYLKYDDPDNLYPDEIELLCREVTDITK